jgi:acetyl esterase/lipase
MPRTFCVVFGFFIAIFLGRAGTAGAWGIPADAVTPTLIPPATEQLSERQEIQLWPGTAPGSANVMIEEKITERSKDPLHPDRALTGVTKPSVTAYLPRKANGTALILAAGGGYEREVIDKEGIEVVSAFVPRGITVFVLKYRLPAEGHKNGRDVPLQDAQRAIRVVRGNAGRWGIDPARVGIIGFSAGGHLAASVATRFTAKVYDPVDVLDAASARPDFVVLMYPVISMEDGIAHAGSKLALLGANPDKATVATYSADVQVGPQTPRTLLILSDDDKSVIPDNAIRYYAAMKRVGVPGELHVFAQGGHGFGIRKASGLPVAVWPNLTWDWLEASGFLVNPR